MDVTSRARIKLEARTDEMVKEARCFDDEGSCGVKAKVVVVDVTARKSGESVLLIAAEASLLDTDDV